MRRRRLLLASLSIAVASACASESSDGPTTATGTPPGASAAGTPLPCDVSLALTRCHDCHSSPTKYGAPMSLVTYEDLVRDAPSTPGVSTLQRALERMKSTTDPMPPVPRERASFKEYGPLDAWLERGFPPGDAAEKCAPAAPDAGVVTPACEPDLVVRAESAYSLPEGTADVYVCYGLDVPATAGKRQVTAIAPRVDDTAVVHHIVVFQADKTESPKPHKCKDIFPIDWKAIYAWAPGGPPFVMPEEAGLPMQEGGPTHLVVQVHYSNLKHEAGHVDRTGVDLCTTDAPRKYDADILWVGGFDFAVPPHKTATVECKFDWGQNWTKYLPLQVVQSWPHMHQLGRKLTTDLVRADGSQTPLGHADPFSFFDQAAYPVDVTVSNGDKFVTRCTWENTTDKTVTWGEETSQEMCFNLLTYYPRIPLPQFSGPAASYLSDCKMQP
ncbi:MAG: hypothetical protein IT374_27190 [Polyangiaceae bacterium]|nr:hypothetical protein [Polyangiaceae bacterium]